MSRLLLSVVLLLLFSAAVASAPTCGQCGWSCSALHSCGECDVLCYRCSCSLSGGGIGVIVACGIVGLLVLCCCVGCCCCRDRVVNYYHPPTPSTPSPSVIVLATK